MINANFVKRVWDKHETHIHISRVLFNEKEMKYLCAVLNDCNFTNYDYITTRELVHYVKQSYVDGKHWKTCAKELRRTNEFRDSIA